MRILLGALLGLMAGAGGHHLYQRFLAPRSNACLDRCGDGTLCREGYCVAAEPRPVRRIRPSVRRRGHPTAAAANSEAGRAPTAAELEVRSEGPTLQSIDYVNPAEKDGNERQLSTAEIDTKVRALDARVVGCIERASGRVDFREGKVVVGFRIERSGRVEKLQVTAPAGLQRAGLYPCLRTLVTALSFPPSSRAAVMRYPYSLR